MKKLLGGILLFSIVTATSSGGYSLAQSGNSEGESLEAKVDAYLKPYLDMNCFSGAVLLAKGERVLLSKGYGMANYDLDAPNTPKTKFKIGSITKTFTVLAIVQLAERRLLSPADKLAKYIPDYPNGDKITIDHLINHRAGIPNIENDDELAVKGYSSTEEIIKLFKNLPLDFQPGERSTYSNSGYVLLAHIIEKVSGKSYEDYLDEHVFKPAGMNDTGHDRHERVVRNKASGYMPAVDESGVMNAPFTDGSIKIGAGSLYSTAEDLYRWERALSSRKLMRNPVEALFPSRNWFGRKVITQDGSVPGFNSSVAKFMDDDLWVVLLSNNYAQVRTIMIKDLAAIALGEKYETPTVKAPAQVSASVIASVAGAYRFGNSRTDFTIFRNARGNLVMRIAGRDSRVIPQSDTEFFVPLWWARFTVTKDDKDKVINLTWFDHGLSEGMQVPRVR